MWQYTKCTAGDRTEKLNKLSAYFHQEADCLKYLSEVQQHIKSTHTTIVLLQDVDANVIVEMDSIPVNNYIFGVIDIDENGIKDRGNPCKTIEQAVKQFSVLVKAKPAAGTSRK